MSELSRRAVLRAGALAAAAVPFASIASAQASTSTSNPYSRSRFTPLVNGAFTLSTSTASWKVTLTQVADLPNAPAGDQNRFRLVFQTAAGGPRQQTCTLRRAGFTATPLFVVPSGQSPGVYEAIVNRA